MAAPPLRIVRRPKRAVTAASAPVTEPARAFRSTMAGTVTRDDWKNDAWDMYDQVGELSYVVGFIAKSCSRVRLVASDIDPETGEPTGSTENREFRELVKNLAGGRLGQAQYQKRAAECLTIPGEYWSAVIHPPEGERWLVVTREEMHTTAMDTVEIDLPEPGQKYEIKKPEDSLFKVWNQHPRKAQESTSPVKACLDALHEIVRTTKKIRNADRSRMINAGLVLLPMEMSLPPVNTPTPEGQALPPPIGMPAVQQLSERLWETANIAEEDEDSMAALIPILATVPGEFIGQQEHMTFGSDITDTEIKKRNDAISRLAMGLDVAPERLLGLGSQSNHWSAWQIADEDVQLHIAPPMETVCQAVYKQMMAPVLQTKLGLDPTKFTLWYDTSELTADPDKGDNGEQAYAAGAITSEAYREYKGLDQDSAYDLTTEEGVLAWAWDRVSAHPELLTDFAPLLPEPIPTLIKAATPAPVPLDVGLPPDQGAPQQEPQTEQNPPPDQSVPTAAANGRRYERIRVL